MRKNPDDTHKHILRCPCLSEFFSMVLLRKKERRIKDSETRKTKILRWKQMLMAAWPWYNYACQWVSEICILQNRLAGERERTKCPIRSPPFIRSQNRLTTTVKRDAEMVRRAVYWQACAWTVSRRHTTDDGTWTHVQRQRVDRAGKHLASLSIHSFNSFMTRPSAAHLPHSVSDDVGRFALRRAACSKTSSPALPLPCRRQTDQYTVAPAERGRIDVISARKILLQAKLRALRSSIGNESDTMTLSSKHCLINSLRRLYSKSQTCIRLAFCLLLVKFWRIVHTNSRRHANFED